MLVPKIVTTLRSNYTRAQLTADLTAGVIVGIVALPLAIAFAIASGVPPARGLYTAIVAGFLISTLGGSRVQIGGPTGAFVVIVYGIVHRYGFDGLVVATIMAGVILVVMGYAGFGAAVKFIPRPVITGFTSGIALIIFSSQVKDFLGMRMGEVPPAFLEKWGAFAAHWRDVNLSTLGVAVASMAIIAAWPKVNRRIPGTFVALVVMTLAVRFVGLPVETIGSRFGAIGAALPAPVIPHITLAAARELVGPAFTIALLAAVESLLSAVVADGMIGGRHRSNQELVAQGVANIVSPLFGGIPATGAIARTVTNVKNGGRTPVAGMVHAITLLVITLFFGRWASLVPLSVLAAILVVVSYHMSEWRAFVSELRSPRSDAAVLVATFGLTVFVDLTVAIGVGMMLTLFLFVRRMAGVTTVAPVTAELRESGENGTGGDEGQVEDVPPGTEVFEITGPFFFGAVEPFRDALGLAGTPPRVLIIRMRHVPVIDATGLHALREVVHQYRTHGTRVILAEVHDQPLAAMRRAGVTDEIGADGLAPSVEYALALARETK